MKKKTEKCRFRENCNRKVYIAFMCGKHYRKEFQKNRGKIINE
jgi:hypothetical protein|tara:strand:+ start:2690 stop:2818 length:129 start_codon:yes stop_codon:yes gene_type:complete